MTYIFENQHSFERLYIKAADVHEAWTKLRNRVDDHTEWLRIGVQED